jgi:hypothetical protein
MYWTERARNLSDFLYRCLKGMKEDFIVDRLEVLWTVNNLFNHSGFYMTMKKNVNTVFLFYNISGNTRWEKAIKCKFYITVPGMSSFLT